MELISKPVHWKPADEAANTCEIKPDYSYRRPVVRLQSVERHSVPTCIVQGKPNDNIGSLWPCDSYAEQNFDRGKYIYI